MKLEQLLSEVGDIRRGAGAFGEREHDVCRDTVAGVEWVAAEGHRVDGFALLAPGDDGSRDRLVCDR